MLNFDAYNGKDLQNLISLLTQFSAAGLTDINLIKKELQKKLPVPTDNKIKSRVKKQQRRCPNCEQPMSCGMVVDGLKINGCRKCRYSEITK